MNTLLTVGAWTIWALALVGNLAGWKAIIHTLTRHHWECRACGVRIAASSSDVDLVDHEPCVPRSMERVPMWRALVRTVFP